MIFWDHLVVVGVRASFGAFAPGAGVWLLSEFVLFAVLSHQGLGEMFLKQTVNCF